LLEDAGLSEDADLLEGEGWLLDAEEVSGSNDAKVTGAE